MTQDLGVLWEFLHLGVCVFSTKDSGFAKLLANMISFVLEKDII